MKWVIIAALVITQQAAAMPGIGKSPNISKSTIQPAPPQDAERVLCYSAFQNLGCRTLPLFLLVVHFVGVLHFVVTSASSINEQCIPHNISM